MRKEVAWWLDHNGSDTVLIALTSGELKWDTVAGDFFRLDPPCLPPLLHGRFADEPRWIDLRAYRDDANPGDARFVEVAADFAAALHGRAKEDLLSQEVREQRRALRLAAGAAIGFAGLLVLAIVVGFIAWTQRNRAEDTLAAATRAANDLVFNLAQKFPKSDVPPAITIEVLDGSLSLLKQLSARGEVSLQLRHNWASALILKADSQLAQGQTDAALLSAKDARQRAEQLVAAYPGDEDFQRLLAVAEIAVGDALKAQRDLPAALRAYLRSLELRKELSARSPENADYQGDVSLATDKIGNVLLAQGSLDSALSNYRDALAIRQSLLQREPDNAQREADVSASNSKIAAVLIKAGDATVDKGAVADALEIYHQVL